MLYYLIYTIKQIRIYKSYFVGYKYKMSNKFITIEGLDGSGKTTIASKIVKYLNCRHNINNIITTHEPGGTPISDKLRLLIQDKSSNELISHVSELLMIYAARSQLLENVIKPFLSKGYWIVGDRYDLSSHAYQGGGRKVNKLLLNLLSEQITNNVYPDLTFYLDVDPKIGLFRIKNRQRLDRMEQEPLSFFNRVRAYYQKRAKLQSNIITIDANQDLNSVAMSIYKYLESWLQ